MKKEFINYLLDDDRSVVSKKPVNANVNLFSRSLSNSSYLEMNMLLPTHGFYMYVFFGHENLTKRLRHLNRNGYSGKRAKKIEEIERYGGIIPTSALQYT